MKIVVCTGGFDPIHSGHLSYLNAARKLGDKLVVGVNSDAWLIRKKGQAFMSYQERAAIVSAIRDVDTVMAFDDSDNTACSLLQELRTSYSYASIIFANGGDRTSSNVPEQSVAGIEFAFGVGGTEKFQSSSHILAEYEAAKTQRDWGHYRVLYHASNIKVKELVVEANQAMSMQRHAYRSEYWFVSQGVAQVETEQAAYHIHAGDEIAKIPVGAWHRLSNPSDTACKIIEIQYGTECRETDIERRYD